MREILFRGKRIYDGKWIYGNLVVDKSLEPHIVPRDFFFEDGHHLVYDDETDNPVFIFKDSVGQYTGLTDNHLKHIFEWDVIKIPWGDGYQNRVVIFENGMFNARSKPDSYGGFFSVSLCSFAGFDGPKMHCEVVGNVFDNPDLLK